MRIFINKRIEYIDFIDHKVFKVKVIITSIPDGLKIRNIDIQEPEGHVYNVVVETEPELSWEYLGDGKHLIFIIEKGRDLFGQLEDEIFSEITKNSFVDTLRARILEVLILSNDIGPFMG